MLDHRSIAEFNHGNDQIELAADDEHQALEIWMNPPERACFTLDLLTTLAEVSIRSQAGRYGPFDYWILGSKVPGVFNYGGDIELFADAIRNRDRRTLRGYGQICIELVLRNRMGMGVGATTISLIEGDALGGGAEAALSSQVVVAERGHRIGFPEIMFNLFPGMGAFHILAERLGPARAESMLTSGKLHTTEEFHDLGLIQVLAEPGEGRAAVGDFMAKARGDVNGRLGIAATRLDSGYLNHKNLLATVERWVDRALDVGDGGLALIDHLVSRQHAKVEDRAEASA